MQANDLLSHTRYLVVSPGTVTSYLVDDLTTHRAPEKRTRRYLKKHFRGTAQQKRAKCLFRRNRPSAVRWLAPEKKMRTNTTRKIKPHRRYVDQPKNKLIETPHLALIVQRFWYGLSAEIGTYMLSWLCLCTGPLFEPPPLPLRLAYGLLVAPPPPRP